MRTYLLSLLYSSLPNRDWDREFSRLIAKHKGVTVNTGFYFPTGTRDVTAYFNNEANMLAAYSAAQKLKWYKEDMCSFAATSTDEAVAPEDAEEYQLPVTTA